MGGAIEGQQKKLFMQRLEEEINSPSPNLYKNIIEVAISRYINNEKGIFKRGRSEFASACYIASEKARLDLPLDIMVKLINGANFPVSLFHRGVHNPHRIKALVQLAHGKESALAYIAQQYSK